MISNKDKLRFEKLDEIAYELFKEGKSFSYISKTLKVKRQSLTRRLKEKYNITYELNGKKPVNSSFFSTPTDKNMYWLGFIFADGNVSSKGNYLEIATKDKEHLEKFKSDISSQHKIAEKIVNTNSYWRIAICDSQIYNDLLNWGVVPKKSFIDINYPKIAREHDLSFLRGFIDGDGSFRIRKQSENHYPIIEITVGFHNISFANQLKEILKSYGIEFKLYKGKTSYRLMSTRKDETISFINMLYKNSTIHLDRKYKKIKSYCRF